MRAVIKGKRVTLRKLKPSDADAIQKYCNDPVISRWLMRLPHPYTKKHAVHFIRDGLKNWKKKTQYVYGIIYEGKLVGTIHIKIEEEDRGQIGYSIAKPYWGKGLMSEAAKLIIKEGFKTLKLHKIYATHHPKNPASGRVMQKAGMKYEGLLREHSKAKGKYWDLVHYGILRREYKG